MEKQQPIILSELVRTALSLRKPDQHIIIDEHILRVCESTHYIGVATVVSFTAGTDLLFGC